MYYHIAPANNLIIINGDKGRRVVFCDFEEKFFGFCKWWSLMSGEVNFFSANLVKCCVEGLDLLYGEGNYFHSAQIKQVLFRMSR